MANESASPTPSTNPITPEIQALIDNARKEGRNEAQADLKKLQDQLTTLSGEKSTISQQLATLTKENETLKTASEITSKAKTPKGELDVQKLIEEVTERVAAQAEKSYSEKTAALQNEVTTLSTTLKAKEAHELRIRLVAEAGGDGSLIPELVKGNTEDEIKASIAESKGIFEKTKARFSPTNATPPAGNGAAPATAVPPVAPAATAVPPMPAATPALDPTAPVLRHEASPGRVAPQAWASQRAERMAALAGRYPSR